MSDPEIAAMATIAAALAELDEHARTRVLNWAASRYDVVGSGGGTADGRSAGDGVGAAGQAGVDDGRSGYEHFAELFAAAAPVTNDDKALVAAYWVQVHGGSDQWQSRKVNAELKNLGHAISNITDALTINMRKKPQRVIQLKKSGGAKQSTKTYKVTGEGISHVEAMLHGGSA
jgi:hypothetical protein